jgi:murein L,D-transpeptidase YafK
MNENGIQGEPMSFCVRCIWLIVIGLTIPLATIPAIASEHSLQPNLVVVKKSERKLYLMNGDKILKRYDVSLGRIPLGPKVREGDMRTPEGSYTLDWKHPNSKFYRAYHISYPNAEDRNQARKRGFSPGGNIMLHGLPNTIGSLVYRVKGRDWTEGCIAVSNEVMDEIWETVAVNTRIDILP